MEIELDEEERDLLARLVDSEIRDVRSEVYHAESHDMKAVLREREEVAKRLQERLESRTPREP